MKNKKRGVFISFEGTEGSGKSTLIRHLAAKIESQGLSVLTTREPGGDPLAEKIRALILSSPMDPRTELFLYEAARAEHLARKILPALEESKVVLCDRFTDSSLAYQSYARGLPWKEVHLLNQIATAKLKPDLTVLLDIDPEAGLKRASDPNRFEAEGIAFQKKVRQGFLKARREAPRRWLVLQVQNKTPEELTTLVYKEFLKRRLL